MSPKKKFSLLYIVLHRVNRELGHGFLEDVYQEALEIEFSEREMDFEREVPLPINYKKKTLKKKYIADFICFDEVVVELKALSELCNEHEAQILNYLKATDKKLGLLINFGKSKLQYKRIINEYYF